MSLPFVLAFGIGQKIPPFELFKIEYIKNGFLSTQKHPNALILYRKVCRQDLKDSKAREPNRSVSAIFLKPSN
jgi:hypothetical protein